jgi:hypothetical protein
MTLLPLLALFSRGVLCAQTEDDEVRDPTHLTSTERFSIHSSPWINLHHFVYQWARSETERPRGDTRRPIRVREKSELDELSADEQAAWQQAIDGYKKIVARPLTFDEELIRTKVRLFEIDRQEAEDSEDELIRLLAAAMPVYEQHWWQEHDRRNRDWATRLVPRIAEHEIRFGERLAAAWHGRWPEKKIRMDLAVYSNWTEAYTTNNPGHIMLSGRGENLWLDFELVFHEASHSMPLSGDYQRALSKEFEAQGREEPERLWHALHFYTAGELTRQLTAELGVEGYQSYAEAGGFYRRASWAGYREAFDRYWRPYLDLEIDRREALAGIVRALAN